VLCCSSLAGTDLFGSDGGSKYAYYLSVCGPLTSAAASTCVGVNADSSACQLQVEQGAQTFDLGTRCASAMCARRVQQMHSFLCLLLCGV
jgi:hypothetical protein